MATDSGYTALTRHIDINFFKALIKSDIKNAISTYGHKNCGLRQKELCDKIKEIIPEKKKIVFQYMDLPSKRKWNNDWDSQRSKYFDKLYKEEGFINMCFPKKYTNDPSLDQLLSKHIEFCKKRDEWKAKVEANPEYNACREYDSWIETEKASFTHEYLENVRNFRKQNVDKYFSTKDHPRGRDPLRTYRNSKFDCEIYNPNSKSYKQIKVTKAPPDTVHLPTSPDVGQESQRKGGKSMPDEKGKIEITQPDVIRLPKSEFSPSDSVTSSINKTKVDGSASGKEPNTFPENAPTKTIVTDDANIHVQTPNYNILIEGTPVDPTIPDSQPTVDNEYLQLRSFIYSFPNNLDGHKIPHYVRHSIKQKPVIIPKTKASYVQGEPIKPTITESFNYIPVQLLYKQKKYAVDLNMQPVPPFIPRSTIFPKLDYNSHRYRKIIPPEKNYSPKYIAMQSSIPFFRRINTITKSTPDSSNNNMDIVKIQLPTPDPSLFRSPFLIFMLAFLTFSTIITLFYLLSKYTTFGLLVGKNKKKKRLKRQLQITKLEKEVSHFNTMDNYSTNDTPYSNKKGNEKNIYNQIKMQKGIIHKNIILPKRKKKNHKAIIDIHMELLNECKNDEWELNKDDFLQICLEKFTKEQNKIYSNSKNSNLITKSLSTENAKEAKMLLWDKWTEKYTPIWENFKRGNTFKILQYYWKEEENSHLYKIKNENSSLNQNEKFSYIQIKKDIWKRWTTKQAKLIEQYKEEQWFKSVVEELENVSDEYKNGKIKDDIFVANIKELENKDNNEDLYKRVKHIFLIKVFIQILMMVIEECIKEESSEKTEIVLDNLIEKLNKEKHENIELENIHQENMNHKEYNEMLEQNKPKDQDNFKELIEG